jgi:hypothetical protein
MVKGQDRGSVPSRVPGQGAQGSLLGELGARHDKGMEQEERPISAPVVHRQMHRWGAQVASGAEAVDGHLLLFRSVKVRIGRRQYC